MRYEEKRKVTIYVHYSIYYYCVGYLEHQRFIDRDTSFYSHYNFLKLEQIKSHQLLLKLLSETRFKRVHTDLYPDTELFKQIKRASISPIKKETQTPKSELLKDYQNLRGIIESEKVSISLNIKETIEKYSHLIDLEKEQFPPEIQTLGKLSYLVR